MTGKSRSGTCIGCEQTVVIDGDNAGVSAGKVLCSDCAGERIRYVTECLDCDWEYECEDTRYNWYHAQVRVQQEGNNHEGHKSFDDEDHETVWRYLGPN